VWRAYETSDKERILSFLETDRFYAAYAIGDLEPELFADCTWAAAEQEGELLSLVLHYQGLNPPALFLMGHPEGLAAILERQLSPEWVYLTCRQDHLDITDTFYAWKERTPMWRMVLRPERFPGLEHSCTRLTQANLGRLARLYELGGGDAFGPAQVQNGAFYGVFERDQLVAAAGTHLVSPTYRLAAIGNVFTHPDYRGRGYGTLTTGAVITELQNRGIDTLVLNVAQSNAEAISLYKRLGFEPYCPFIEGQATRLQES
jgi:ribosomal protein S18 acetylase RimI-like enzyme